MRKRKKESDSLFKIVPMSFFPFTLCFCNSVWVCAFGFPLAIRILWICWKQNSISYTNDVPFHSNQIRTKQNLCQVFVWCCSCLFGNGIGEPSIILINDAHTHVQTSFLWPDFSLSALLIPFFSRLFCWFFFFHVCNLLENNSISNLVFMRQTSRFKAAGQIMISMMKYANGKIMQLRRKHVVNVHVHSVFYWSCQMAQVLELNQKIGSLHSHKRTHSAIAVQWTLDTEQTEHVNGTFMANSWRLSCFNKCFRRNGLHGTACSWATTISKSAYMRGRRYHRWFSLFSSAFNYLLTSVFAVWDDDELKSECAKTMPVELHKCVLTQLWVKHKNTKAQKRGMYCVWRQQQTHLQSCQVFRNYQAVSFEDDDNDYDNNSGSE